jgi:hypothetical protein
MKRFVLSIILGLILPFVCFLAIGIMTDYMSPSSLTEIKIYNQPAPGILLAPFSIPIYLDIILKEKQIAPSIFDTFLFRILSFILFNWGFYGIIIYLVLGKFSRFKRQKTIFSEIPPLPPKFGQIN